MKFLLLLLFPTTCFAQLELDKISLLNETVRILAPKELSPMTEQMWSLKYQKRARPVMVLTDEEGEVNFIADLTNLSVSESQVPAFKDAQLQQLRKSRPDMSVLDEGVKTINGNRVGYFKFITEAIDQKVFNYYFFTAVDGKILLFSFNCIEKLQKKWEKTADAIFASLEVK